MNIVLVYWTIQLYMKIRKSFEPAYLCLSLIEAYYCVGFEHKSQETEIIINISI